MRDRGPEPVARPRLARDTPDLPAVAQEGKEEQWSDGERHQGELPVDPQHHGQHPDQEAGVVDDDVGRVRDQVVDGVDVAAQARGQVPDPLAVVEAQREALHVSEHAPP